MRNLTIFQQRRWPLPLLLCLFYPHCKITRPKFECNTWNLGLIILSDPSTLWLFYPLLCHSISLHLLPLCAIQTPGHFSGSFPIVSCPATCIASSTSPCNPSQESCLCSLQFLHHLELLHLWWAGLGCFTAVHPISLVLALQRQSYSVLLWLL